ncbi:MAG: dynamin family protein, partial [Brachymonas sp.]|nr:dynamin family protein [Brachymonas sp.]
MFNENIHHHSIWRQEVDTRLKTLSQWLDEHDLLPVDLKFQLDKMQLDNRSDKIMVAFVAEFSRGKSELINAIFFAGYGKRIMPASAGRTTMCPTELGYDAKDSACLRLLPIQTRLEPQPLMEWRLVPEQWTKVELDLNDPDQLIAAMNKVAETIEVTIEEARALGFWQDDAPDNPMPTATGTVEVPRWRHALINMDHPLLRQGLIILDTPGLNAIGAEPELTMSLIPQAQAVVFILATDTGVTASDLAMWREFLAGADDDASRFVVLNKIDTLWDALSTPEQIEGQIERQRKESA